MQVYDCNYGNYGEMRVLSWTGSACSVKAQVARTGEVSVVHSPTSDRKHLGLDSNELVRVAWEGGRFPTADTGCATDGGVCSVHGDTCFCSTSVATHAVFTDSQTLPTAAEVLAQLHIGAPPPELFGSGDYSRCTTAPCSSASDVHIFTATAAAGALDKSTIFKVEVHGSAVYLANLKSTVTIGTGLEASDTTFEFRNPPSIMNPLMPTVQDAQHEVDALLAHLAYHPNTAPFYARHLIQRFVSSNPSPSYVLEVATAFTHGEYKGKVYSGKHGDLGAALGAVLLSSEARAAVLDLDPACGTYREPLIKVMHFMRAMGLAPKDDREVELTFLAGAIGMEPYLSETASNFYRVGFQPAGPLGEASLQAPETELLTPVNLLGFLNAMSATIDLGLSGCVSGIGSRAGFGNCGYSARLKGEHRVEAVLTWSPAGNETEAVVEELSVLLTAGRLNRNTKQVIAAAYEETLPTGRDEALHVAMELFLASAEFHVSSRNVLIPVARPPRPDKSGDGGNGYKAIVVLFMEGGSDSFNVLVPYASCMGADLYEEYSRVRGGTSTLAINKNQLDEIDVADGAQPCARFGVHAALSEVTRLYKAGDAAFVANVGPLITPVTKAQYYSKSVELPPSLYSQDQQRRHVQTVDATGTSASGILGRILDSLSTQGQAPYRVGGYSIMQDMSVSSRMLDGTVHHDELDQGPPAWYASKQLAHYIARMLSNRSQSMLAETYGQALTDMLQRSEELGTTWAATPKPAGFGSQSVSLQLEKVARMIKARGDDGRNEREAYFVQVTGFDLHKCVNDCSAFKWLLTKINTALESFVAEMQRQSLWDDVVVISASEFGRTLTPRRHGADRGWGGHYFVLGGSVKGGRIHGQYPSELTDAGAQIVDDGRVIPTTPWEGVWNAVAQWFGVLPQSLDKVLPNRPNFLPNGLIEPYELFDNI